MAFILDQVLHAWGALTIVSTVLCTFLLWLGFVAVTLLHSVTMSTGLCTIMRSMPAIAWSAWWQWV
ncbi:MAG: hypothetical protein E5Y59_04040 [Mesorhizobium sp.]|nr:MAG: hypothetical protein E5Y59_04040 [Mesorhizobium sp.]